MDEETTTTHVPIEQPPTQNRRLVLVGIVVTTIGIVYVLYRLLRPYPSPKKTIKAQQTIQIKQTTPTAPHFQVFRKEITEQIKKVRNIKGRRWFYFLEKYFNKKFFLNNKILNGVHERIGPIRSFITGGCMARDESTSGIHHQNQFVEPLFPLLSQTAFQERSPRVSHVFKPISPAIMV